MENTKRILTTVRYELGTNIRFLKGEYLEETEIDLKIKGLIDGTTFIIAKKTILERQDREEVD